MKQTMRHAVIVAALVALGWAAGRAQTTRGDFELRINAPSGATSVECVRGCRLIGARDIENPSARQMQTYEFSCSGQQCRASVVGFRQP
jgi:hypothetical protein